MLARLATVSNQIKKSQADKRNYRYIKLPNQMKCILVQDTEA